jgi:NADPH:quinone reductase-like Zn-dependent oxidoreductase
MITKPCQSSRGFGEPLDWHCMEGTLDRSSNRLWATQTSITARVDFAGTVEAVGKNVTQFKTGRRGIWRKTGAFAEYVCVSRIEQSC